MLTRPGGIVAFLTPTSFLSGSYFNQLRSLLDEQAPLAAIEFIPRRTGVFAGVLQETALVVFRRTARGTPPKRRPPPTPPAEHGRPWLIPRSHHQESLLYGIEQLTDRLADYGYQVNTGPLVWNRHKPQMKDRPGAARHPIVWAEAVRPDGSLILTNRPNHRNRPNHKPYLAIRPGQRYLLTHTGCVLVHRTTSKEQPRRIVAAELPPSVPARHAGVVVENHLNILTPNHRRPPVSTAVLTALLNSDTADQLFRCISGSVAVSAYELNALPLPRPGSTRVLQELIDRNAGTQAIQRQVEHLYATQGP